MASVFPRKNQKPRQILVQKVQLSLSCEQRKRGRKPQRKKKGKKVGESSLAKLGLRANRKKEKRERGN